MYDYKQDWPAPDYEAGNVFPLKARIELAEQLIRALLDHLDPDDPKGDGVLNWNLPIPQIDRETNGLVEEWYNDSDNEA